MSHGNNKKKRPARAAATRTAARPKQTPQPAPRKPARAAPPPAAAAAPVAVPVAAPKRAEVPFIARAEVPFVAKTDVPSISPAKADVPSISPAKVEAPSIIPATPATPAITPPEGASPAFSLPADRASTTVEQVEAQIAELESRLDRMIRQSEHRGSASNAREAAESAVRAVADRLATTAPIERPGGDDGNVRDAARDLLSGDYYLRQWGRLGMRNRSEEVDDFGLDHKYEARWRPLFDLLYQRYFRGETVGADNIPADGRCIVVANHSGTLPYDGVMLKTAVRLAHPAKRELRWLAEDFIFYLPFLGAFMNRIGAVRACQENAERLLRKGCLVGVFPEGVKGIGKLYRDRYKLQRFGRGGFVRLCLRTQTPIVPCAIIGAEEASPMLARVEYMAKALGVPYVPVTPTFPALGAFGLVPAPTKWRIEFGEPLSFDGYGPEAADDSLLVGRLAERVRATIQSMLDRALSKRQSVWFG